MGTAMIISITKTNGRLVRRRLIFECQILNYELRKEIMFKLLLASKVRYVLCDKSSIGGLTCY
jgi:hypothetical protein